MDIDNKLSDLVGLLTEHRRETAREHKNLLNQVTGLTARTAQLEAQLTAMKSEFEEVKSLAYPQRHKETAIALLQHFDGKNSWKDFLQHFENVARANQWTESYKGLRLSTAIVGDALRAQRSLPDSQKYNFCRLVESLNQLYSVGGSSLAKALFHKATLNSAEGYVEYAHRLRELATQTHPDLPRENAEGLLIHQFTTGISDSTAGEHIAMHNPETLSQAVNIALTLEACKKSRKLTAPSNCVKEKTKR
ncbi:uncharacterized protein LOC144744048 [Ciona intestinalis]